MNEINFQSTRIPMASKKIFEDYIKILPPKDYASFHNREVIDCLYDLRHTDNKIGILWGKDRCFYIFGNNKAQDIFIFRKLKNFDANVKYIKDVE